MYKKIRKRVRGFDDMMQKIGKYFKITTFN